jgi:hypothetical protein
MKIHLLITIFLLNLIAFISFAQAQISLTSSDASAINAVGNVITNHFDSTTTTVNIGTPGATSWDFSALNSHYTNTFTSVVPSSTPYYSSVFPTSNVVFIYKTIIEDKSADGWQYSTQNSGNYLMNGIVNKSVIESDTFLIKSVYSPAQLDLPLPFTFNSQWNSDFVITNTTYYNDITFLTTTANHTESVTVDAWGNMTMPGGIVLQALRVRRDDRYTSNSPPFYVRTISYSFITKSGSVVEVVAKDTTASNSGTIQTDGVTWTLSSTLGVEKEEQISNELLLEQNYPNPFIQMTNIRFSVPSKGYVTLRAFDALGKEAAQLISQDLNEGTYTFVWDATGFESGVYFIRLEAGAYSETKNIVLLK